MDKLETEFSIELYFEDLHDYLPLTDEELA